MVSDNFFNDLKARKKKIAIVGLGYVGIPLFTNLIKHFEVIGFDINSERLEDIKHNRVEDIIDLTDIDNIEDMLTSDEKDLGTANLFIVTVPTPVDHHNNPDLTPVINATELIARNMPKDSIIVYESTVYPGLTEEVCVPLLEEKSGYKNEIDFWVGYSPERINPGDEDHTIKDIVKIISAQDKDSLEIIKKVYSKIVKKGLHEAESIKVAEAAKVIENIQRDLNIALMNELAMIFTRLGIDTNQVLDAAKTKWNFLDFRPGMVGGHCIGVDPFYLTYKANELGYSPEIILAGRKINENMSSFIGNEILKRLLSDLDLDSRLKIVLFGITFKENIKDIRNSKIVDLYNYFKQYGVDTEIFDPIANKQEVYDEYNIDLIDFDDIKNIDAAVFCIAHDYFKKIDLKKLKSNFKNKTPYIFDIKGIFDKQAIEDMGFNYWSL